MYRESREVPIAPRVVTSRPPVVAAPEPVMQAEAPAPVAFAETDLQEEVAGPAEVVERPLVEMHAEPAAGLPELVPVPRSVFDDDFFQTSRRMQQAESSAVPAVQDTRMPSARGFDSPDSTRPLRVQFTESGAELGQAMGVADPAVRMPTFTGVLAVEPADADQSDELDIPAFLRRGH